MPADFPPWSNTAVRWGLAAVLAVVLGAPIALMMYVRTPYVTEAGFEVEQPVEFDHRHHVRDDAIECRYCHSTVEVSRYAGMPSTQTCMGCHAQIYRDSPLLEPVRRSYFSGRPLQWRRVHDLPDFVYFDHSIHVAKGIGCSSCHGRVDQMARVRQVASLQMGWCLDCHRRPAAHVRPLEAVTDMAWAPPADQLARGALLARELGVESNVHCTTCHR